MDTMQNQLACYIALLIRRYFKIDLDSAKFKCDLTNDLDFDPQDLKLLIIKIENEFKIFIYDEEFNKIRTISDVANLIIEKKYPELSVKRNRINI
jgi:acyl carrier protein